MISIYHLFEQKVILDFPDTRQSNIKSCGVAATQGVSIYYGLDKPEDYFEGKDKHEYQSAKEIVNFFKKEKLKVIEKHEMTIDDLKNHINKNVPVIVAIQAWAEKPIDYSKTFKDGHWVIVIGYDSKNLYFDDPSISDNIATLSYEEFLNRWHDKEEDKLYLRYGIAVYGTPKFKSEKIQKIK